MPPSDQDRLYQSLYNDFTVAYVNVHVVRREFYPLAKKLVERTEPELNTYLEKVSGGANQQTNFEAHEQLVRYMGQFDDFTLIANRMFSDLQMMLDKSDAYMNKMLERKTNPNKPADDPTVFYKELMPELDQLVNGLKQISERAALLESKMQKLETEWEKTKEKIA